MIESIISEALHRMRSLSPEQGKELETVLYIVLNKYELQPKSTEVRVINQTWQDDLQRFLERKRISGKSERTLSQYKYHLTRILSFINKPIREVTEGDLNNYLDVYRKVRKVGNVYLEGIRLCMSSFFTWQHDKGFIPKNPARGIDPIKCEKTIKKPFSDEELEKIRRQCEQIRDMAMVEFLYATGVRISEMCSLNRDDVRITDKELIVYGKGAKERTVYLTPISCMYLSAYLYQRTDGNPALFVGLKKPYSRLTTAGAESRLREIGSRAGVEKVHPHRFRRTMATNLLRKGMPLEEVSQVLGHEKLETTLIYAILDKDRVKADHHRYMCA